MTELQERIVRTAEEQVGAAYVWGAWGGLCTVSYRKKYAGYTPAKAALIRKYCPVMSGRQSACAGCPYDGRRAFDCRGLTRWVLEEAGVITLSGQGSTSQYNAAENWAQRGEIAGMPDEAGVVLFRKKNGAMTHTGLYIGNGEVIHAKGHASGVVRQSVRSANFTHYAVPKGLDIQNEGGKTEEEKSMRTIRRGDKGLEVGALQKRLVELGNDLDIDGVFGQKTENALRMFQASNGLTADGICGAKTWAALGVAQDTAGTAEERLTALEERVRALEDAVTALKARLDTPEEGA